MRSKWAVLIATLVLAGMVLYGRSWAAAAGKAAEVGQKAPDFALKDVYGKEFKLADFKDKIVVLEWLNKDCPVSRGAHEKQQMQKTYKKYAAKGVVWLGIDSTDVAKAENTDPLEFHAVSLWEGISCNLCIIQPLPGMNSHNFLRAVCVDTDGNTGLLYNQMEVPWSCFWIRMLPTWFCWGGCC